MRQLFWDEPLATVPCGSRGLPIALRVPCGRYHRKTLEACFPPEATWPDPTVPTVPSLRQRLGLPARPPLAASTKKAFLSQNHIEEHLLALVLRLVCRRRPQGGRLRRVIVADRGFARASLFRWLQAHAADFVIRFDAETHVYRDGAGESQPVAAALPVQRGEQRWVEQAWYQQEERVPMAMLAIWDEDADEPWYLGTSLGRADWTAQCYRWRMRCECTHRDEQTGILLRSGGDDHAMTNVLHMHRLALALCLAEWFCALVGLQAWRELPALLDASPTLLTSEQEANTDPPTALDQPPLELAPPLIEPDASYLAQGPAEPPPPLPSVVTAPSRPSLQTTRRRRAKRGRQTLRGARLAELSAPRPGGAPSRRPAPPRAPARPLGRHLPLAGSSPLATLAGALSAAPLVAGCQSCLIGRHTPPFPPLPNHLPSPPVTSGCLCSGEVTAKSSRAELRDKPIMPAPSQPHAVHHHTIRTMSTRCPPNLPPSAPHQTAFFHQQPDCATNWGIASDGLRLMNVKRWAAPLRYWE